MQAKAGRLWVIWVILLLAWTFALVTPYPVQAGQKMLPPDAAFSMSKLLHAGMYAFLTGFGAFLPLRGGWRWLPLIVMSLHGFGTEYLQTFVPLRYGCLSDVGIDHLGILVGFLLTLKRWFVRR